MKKIINILQKLMCFILIILIFIVIIGKFNVNLFGYQAYIVRSGSMSPTFNVGDLIITKEVKESDLKKENIISFKENTNVITHRIIDIEEDNNELHYITKGDNNNTPDANYVLYENIKGKMILTIPNIGSIIDFMKSSTFLIILMTIVFSITIYKYMLKDKDIYEEKEN